jgi:hypothetical protein
VEVPWEGSVAPLGVVSVEWRLKGEGEKASTDSFLVVEAEGFDFLLGGRVS